MSTFGRGPLGSLQRTYGRARGRLSRAATQWRCPRVKVSLPPSDVGRTFTLVICGVFRNEADYLREWIEFHRLLGVEKFVLFALQSEDDWRAVLAPYIAQDIVTVHEIPEFKPNFDVYTVVQTRAYDACLSLYRDQARWIAFLDVDEFLFPTKVDSLVEFLRDYEDHPALAVHWVMFSTSGHIQRPSGLVTECYEKCYARGNKWVKLVVDPKQTSEFSGGPHRARYLDGRVAVDELGQPVPRPFSRPPTVEKIRINHYFTKSVEEYLQKLDLNRDWESGHRGADGLFMAEREYASDVDTSIQRFVPRLRAALSNTECGAGGVEGSHAR